MINPFYYNAISSDKKIEFQSWLIDKTENYNESEHQNYLREDRIRISWNYQGNIINRILNKDIQNNLFDAQGLPRKDKKDIDGKLLVIPMSYKSPVLSQENEDNIESYAKFYPELYGDLLAVNNLSKCISGVSLQTQLVKIINLRTNTIYPVQVSINEGRTLKKLISRNDNLNDIEETLSKYYLTLKVIENLLMHPEDEKFDNVCPQYFKDADAKIKIRLISIDPDHAFVDALKEENERGSNQIKIKMKSVVFCFKSMLNIIDSDHKMAFDTFNKLDPYEVIKAWLDDLICYNNMLIDNKNNNMQGLFKEEEIKNFAIKNNCILPIIFAPGDINKIYQRWMRIKTAINSKKINSHNLFYIIEQLEPRLSDLYRLSVERGADVVTIFNGLTTDYIIQYDSNKRLITFRSTLNISQKFSSLLVDKELEKKNNNINSAFISRIMCGVQNAKNEELECIHKYSINAECIKNSISSPSFNIKILDEIKHYPYVVEKILKMMSFDIYKEDIQSKILAIFSQTMLHEINIDSCKMLDSNILEHWLIHSPDIRTIRLNNNAQISAGLIKDDVYLILKHCKNIENLLLNHLNIHKIGFYAIWDLPIAKYLQKLKVNNCAFLEKIELHAPQLKKISLINLPKLYSVDLRKPAAETIVLIKLPLLKNHRFNKNEKNDLNGQYVFNEEILNSSHTKLKKLIIGENGFKSLNLQLSKLTYLYVSQHNYTFNLDNNLFDNLETLIIKHSSINDKLSKQKYCFNKLKILNLECTNIFDLDINSPQLEYLTIKNEQEINKIKTYSNEMVVLEISNSAIKDIGLFGAIKSSCKVSEVKIIGCKFINHSLINEYKILLESDNLSNGQMFDISANKLLYVLNKINDILGNNMLKINQLTPQLREIVKKYLNFSLINSINYSQNANEADFNKSKKILNSAVIDQWICNLNQDELMDKIIEYIETKEVKFDSAVCKILRNILNHYGKSIANRISISARYVLKRLVKIDANLLYGLNTHQLGSRDIYYYGYRNRVDYNKAALLFEFYRDCDKAKWIHESLSYMLQEIDPEKVTLYGVTRQECLNAHSNSVRYNTKKDYSHVISGVYDQIEKNHKDNKEWEKLNFLASLSNSTLGIVGTASDSNCNNSCKGSRNEWSIIDYLMSSGFPIAEDKQRDFKFIILSRITINALKIYSSLDFNIIHKLYGCLNEGRSFFDNSDIKIINTLRIFILLGIFSIIKGHPLLASAIGGLELSYISYKNLSDQNIMRYPPPYWKYMDEIEIEALIEVIHKNNLSLKSVFIGYVIANNVMVDIVVRVLKNIILNNMSYKKVAIHVYLRIANTYSEVIDAIMLRRLLEDIYNYEEEYILECLKNIFVISCSLIESDESLFDLLTQYIMYIACAYKNNKIKSFDIIKQFIDILSYFNSINQKLIELLSTMIQLESIEIQIAVLHVVMNYVYIKPELIKILIVQLKNIDSLVDENAIRKNIRYKTLLIQTLIKFNIIEPDFIDLLERSLNKGLMSNTCNFVNLSVTEHTNQLILKVLNNAVHNKNPNIVTDAILLKAFLSIATADDFDVLIGLIDNAEISNIIVIESALHQFCRILPYYVITKLVTSLINKITPNQSLISINDEHSNDIHNDINTIIIKVLISFKDKIYGKNNISNEYTPILLKMLDHKEIFYKVVDSIYESLSFEEKFRFDINKVSLEAIKQVSTLINVQGKDVTLPFKNLQYLQQLEWERAINHYSAELDNKPSLLIIDKSVLSYQAMPTFNVTEPNQLNKLLNTLLSCLDKIMHKPNKYQYDVSSDCATAEGIQNELINILGHTAFVINPKLSSLYNLFSNNMAEARQGAINYVKILNGFTNIDSGIQEKGVIQRLNINGNLTKPLILILDTHSINTKFGYDRNNVVGNHWVTCVILPRKYITPIGYAIQNESELIYFIDSLHLNSKLPNALKDIFTSKTIHEFVDDNLYRHEISAAFPNGKFIDCINVPQQDALEDSGWWAVYNSLMLILTGRDAYTYQFKQRSRIPIYSLRYLFPHLSLTSIELQELYRKHRLFNKNIATLNDKDVSVVFTDQHNITRLKQGEVDDKEKSLTKDSANITNFIKDRCSNFLQDNDVFTKFINSREKAIQSMNLVSLRQEILADKIKRDKEIDDITKRYGYLLQIGDPELRKLLRERVKNNDVFLEELVVRSCEIDDEEMMEWSIALKVNITLTIVQFENTHMSNAGAMVLSSALKNNRNLRCLILSNNDIDDGYAKTVASFFEYNSMLQLLDLRNNKITINGAEELAHVFKYNKTLSIKIEGNPAGELLNKIDAWSEQNESMLKLRRSQFLRSLIVLTKDQLNRNNLSYWNMLPSDIREHILSLITFNSSDSIGKNSKQISKCAEFINNNIQLICLKLQAGHSFKLIEDTSKSIGSKFHFQFFKHKKNSVSTPNHNISSNNIFAKNHY